MLQAGTCFFSSTHTPVVWHMQRLPKSTGDFCRLRNFVAKAPMYLSLFISVYGLHS